MDRTNLYVGDFLSEVSDRHSGGDIHEETVAGWRNHDLPVRPKHRPAFDKFLRYLCDPAVTKKWQDAFTDCWARHARAARPFNKVISRHHEWITSRHIRPLMGEAFPVSKIYVPIKLVAHGVRQGIEETDRVFIDDEIYAFARHGFKDSQRLADKTTDWLFIKGGPGSGKSVLALTLASKLTKGNSAVFFLRGAQISNLKRRLTKPMPDVVDDTIALADLFDAFLKSSKRHLTIIIDGLDEIGMMDNRGRQQFLELLEQVRQQCELLKPIGKTFKALIFGRNTLTDIAADSFRQPCLLLEMGDLSGAFGAFRSASQTYDDDRRLEWWNKYLRAKGIDAASLGPRFLTDESHPLHELSSEPLVLFLVTRAALPKLLDAQTEPKSLVEQVDKYTESRNRNDIYADIIENVRHGKEWKEQEVATLGKEAFISVLQHMALACWHHHTERTTTVAGVQEIIQDEKTDKAFQRILFDIEDDMGKSLVTAFYYRFQKPEGANAQTVDVGRFEIEFAHRTFVEYLVARFMFDRFEHLLELFVSRSHDDKTRAAAESSFATYMMAGEFSHYIQRFAYDEARLRLNRHNWKHWCNASELMQDIQNLNVLDTTSDFVRTTNASALARLSGASQAIVMLWGSLARARYTTTRRLAGMGDGSDGFGSFPLMEIPTSHTLGDFARSIGDAAPEPFGFLSSVMSGLDWTGADMPGVYISGGEIEGSNFTECVFEGGIWHSLIVSSVDLKQCNMRRSRLQDFHARDLEFNEAYLRHSIVMDSQFQDCNFFDARSEFTEYRNVHFIDCELTGTIFARCIFDGCKFVSCKIESCDFEAAWFSDTEFQDCKFRGNRSENSNFDEIA